MHCPHQQNLCAIFGRQSSFISLHLSSGDLFCKNFSDKLIYLPKNSPASFVRGINTVGRFIFVYDSVRYPYDPVKLFEFLKVRKYHSLLSSPLRRNFDLICITKKLATSFIWLLRDRLQEWYIKHFYRLYIWLGRFCIELHCGTILLLLPLMIILRLSGKLWALSI